MHIVDYHKCNNLVYILGQPRMVKVVQNSNNNQSAAQVKIKSKALKIIKLPATSTEGNNQVDA